MTRVAYLTSDEHTGWLGPRACRVVEEVSGVEDRPALLVDLEPPAPGGQVRVVLQPRYEDDPTAWPAADRAVTVNVFSAEVLTGQGRPIDSLLGVADLYAEADAAKTAAVAKW